MADEIDFGSKPPKLGSDVRRVDDKGFPTEYLMDQENREQAWIEGTAVDLQTKITTVQAVADDASARVTDESIARVEGDEALAVRITNVEATAGSGFASGSLEFSASAAPTGYTAKYDLQLTAGDAKTGFSVLADSGGASAIMLSASQFLLTDPSYSGGGLGNVFYYSSGYFRFGVPVIFSTPEIETNAVSVPTSYNNSAEVATSNGGWVDIADVTVGGIAGGIALVIFNFGGSTQNNGGGGVSSYQEYRITRTDAFGTSVMGGTGANAGPHPTFILNNGILMDQDASPSSITYKIQIQDTTTGGAGRTLRANNRKLNVLVMKR